MQGGHFLLAKQRFKDKGEDAALEENRNIIEQKLSFLEQTTGWGASTRQKESLTASIVTLV